MNAKNVATDILSRTASACNQRNVYALNYAINAIKAADFLISNIYKSHKYFKWFNTQKHFIIEKFYSRYQIQKLNRNWNNDTNESTAITQSY